MPSLAVPHAASSAATVRRAVVADLRDAGVRGDVIHDVALVVTELVGNAVRHGAPLADATVHVTWDLRGPVVHVEVRDGGGPNSPKSSGPRADGEGGRGLGIVSVVSSRWGVDQGGDGVVVWAELRTAADSRQRGRA